VHRIEKVHAAEVLRSLQCLCQKVHRYGRRIGCDNSVHTDLCLNFSEYALFDLGILDHCLNHQINITKLAIRQGRLDCIEHLGHTLRLELATRYLLAQQLARLVQTSLNRFLIDILHDDRHTVGCTLISHASAHDASAQHRGLVDLTCILCDATGNTL